MNKELFEKGLAAMGLSADGDTVNQFEKYSELLLEWNKKFNLTAITDEDEITVKHFLDSLLPLKYTEIEGSVADIGTGAGFPGIPIKLMIPDIDLTLIDSVGKKVRFLETLSKELGIDANCIHGRAEEPKKNGCREAFDCVLSRAVANMTVLSEYCLPYLKVGGRFIALKGRDSEEEIERAKPIIGTLGGKITDIITAPLPESDIIRTIVITEKTKPTPKQFPRSEKRIKRTSKDRQRAYSEDIKRPRR